MAEFTVRVVLHDNATWDDYQSLHSKMWAAAFRDEIIADTGVTYKLPPAEYYGFGEITIETCRAMVADIAGQVKPRFAVFVTEGGNRAWQGMEMA